MNSSNRFLAILILLGTMYWSFSDMMPSYSSKKEVIAPTEFSIDNALYHLKNISQKVHYPGTDEHKVVQNYLVNELKKLGLQPEIQIETAFNKKWVAGTTAENIIAKIKGTTDGKALVLLTHYDSNPHSAIGAADAGSGVVTILEGIRAFLARNKQPKNDIIILFSDAEELGLLGAQAFVNSHSLAKNVGLILNFEARGSGGPSYMLMETNSKNGKLIQELVKANPNHIAANSLMYSVYKMLPNDTDLTVFREDADINGFNFAFIGDHFDYHTAQDNYERLDRESLMHQADYLTNTLKYFADSDIENLNSDTDYVYVNFPFMSLLTYPFSWILPMLLIAILIIIALIIIGFQKQQLSLKGIAKGFLAFIGGLVVCGVVSYGVWELILIIHPGYNDMLHGFTYNGYQYITAFAFLNLWLLIKIYTYFKDEKVLDLLIAPIIVWLIINTLVYQYLQGAGFYSIPVFIALLIVGVLLFTKIKKKNIAPLVALLSIPTVYIFVPFIKTFPVGLGLKSLFLVAIFIVLIFGLLLPVFHQQKKKSNLEYVFGFFAFLFFGIATFNSGFSIDKKKPNSLVYIQNEDTKTAFFGTYNNTLDSYTKQIFNTDYTEGSIKAAETKSKYNTRFKYRKETKSKYIKTSEITIQLDTVVGNERRLEFVIQPKRKVNKYEIYNNNPLHIKELCANGAETNSGKPFLAKKGTLLIFHMANNDESLKVNLTLNKDEVPSFIVNEISYDLLTNPSFNITPRGETMMPMPFVTNDAIICTKTLKL